jgi:Flp pilus assembly CpaE family ATPase
MRPSPFSRRRDDAVGNVVDRAPFLALLEPDVREQVRKRLNRRRIAVGKPLFRAGEAADALYIVESGRFRVFMAERPGNERVLQFLGPGEIIGEAAFMAETLHVAGAEAIENASVLRLTRADFENLLGHHEAVLQYLATLIAQRQEQANSRLAADSAPEETRSQRGYVTAVYSPRGGAGVTTLAVNLAIALAEKHPDDTVLLDLDVLFGHVLSNLWLEPRAVLAQISPVTLRGVDRAGLDHYLLKHASSLRVFAGASHAEEGQAITGEHVRSAVAALRRHFGHIVLDLPHAFNDVTLVGLDLSDRVLVVATPERATLADLRESRRIFADVLRLTPDRVSYLLNHPQPYSSSALSEFASATGTAWTEVAHGGEGPSQAALRGESLLSTRPNNAVARAVTSLADQITREARELAALSGRSV